jgi:hypothetical protein
MKLNFTITKFPSGSFLIHESATSERPFDSRPILTIYNDGSKQSDLPRICEGVPEALTSDQYFEKFFKNLFSK